uniref:Secreted protein n=1 Tax=Streptomyces sp. NBC_00049 TaxID=2903617 RepID=A0AAU2JNZ7_9ACTN
MQQGWKGRRRPGRRRRAAASVGVFTAALWLCVGGLFTAPPAQAAPGGCKGRLAGTVPFETGEVRVYKSRTRACAVTVARGRDEQREIAVSIQPRGGVPVRKIGRSPRYAGPVTVGAISRCVYVKGSVGAGSADSGWILC